MFYLRDLNYLLKYSTEYILFNVKKICPLFPIFSSNKVGWHYTKLFLKSRPRKAAYINNLLSEMNNSS